MKLPASSTELSFPEGFIFGAATAAFQVEGAVTADGRGPSIWDTFCKIPGKIKGGANADVACGHYDRVEEDLDLMASMGLDAYRFSIAWPRIHPSGRGDINQPGMDFYSRLVDGLLERDITPFVTLFHWDLPQALEDAGGWPNRDTAYAFSEYVENVTRALGDRVSMWSTLNEPSNAALLGYAAGVFAPGRTDPAAALQAIHTLNLAHGLGAQAIRANTPEGTHVSVTLDLFPLEPEGDRGEEAVSRLSAVNNKSFSGPMLNGAYPEELFDYTREYTDWSFIKEGDLSVIHQPIDSLGVNYYMPIPVDMWDGSSPRTDNLMGTSAGVAYPGAADVIFVQRPGPRTTYGWLVDAPSFERHLLRLHDEFPGLPLLVTENGGAFDDVPVVEGDGVAIHDAERVEYFQTHLAAAKRAIDRGVNLQGYFAWSLMDNFEWAEGYSIRFGLVGIDFDTLDRTMKDSGKWYSDFLRAR